MNKQSLVNKQLLINNKPNKMEVMAKKIVKLLKGYTISEADITLNNARNLISRETKVK